MSVTAAELRQLAETYARGADRGDGELYASAFHPDATLHVFRAADQVNPDRIRRGHDELRGIPGMLGRYIRTFHMLGQSTYEIGDERATGEVYCIAHHLFDNGDSSVTNHVMYIRYQDVYEPDGGGTWKIRQRGVVVDWTEQRPADNPFG